MADAQLVRVDKYFDGTQVLSGIDLQIEDGEFLTLVGSSGSGKSTLLRILAGLETVSDGSVFIGGRDVTQEPAKKRNISMVFQNYALYPHMTVADNITFGMRIRKESKAARKEALEQVTSMLQLEGLLARKPRQLSGGQRQRVAMARAIVHAPDLFLMDEPLSNLDAKLRNEVRLSIMELQHQLRCTMVYVTHDQIEAMSMADRIVVLEGGVIQQVGSPQELYQNPDNLFTAGFIGTPSMNFLEITRDDGSYSVGGNSPLHLPDHIVYALDNIENPVLGIRPEHLHREDVSQKIVSSSEKEQSIINAIITSTEMLGSEFLIHTKTKNGGVAYKLILQQ